MGSGDPMFGRKVRFAALAASAVGVLLLAGCSAGEHADTPPPASDYRAETSTPDLMGAPPPPNASQAQDGLLGGPTAPGSVSSHPLPATNPNVRTWRRPDGTLVTAMRPIPNPGASHRTARPATSTATTTTAYASQRAEVAATGDTRTWRRADGTLVTAMRPVANPRATHRVHAAPRVHATIPTHHAAPVAHAVAKPAPRPVARPAVVAAAPKPVAKPAPKPVAAKPAVVAAAKPAPTPAKPVTAPAAAKPVTAKAVTPKTVAPAPAPLKAVEPTKPTTPLTKPPVVTADKPVAPPAAPAKPATKLEKLQAAVATPATNNAVLAAGESLSKNQPGQVTLSLPTNLGEMIKAEAGKLGLSKAAKKTSAYAQLSGDGYEVTPNGRQTAVVKPGEPTTFAWQVKPGPDAKGQLKSEFGVEMSGAKPAQTFALGTITKRVLAAPEAAKAAAGKMNLGALNGDVTLPGVGTISIKTLVGAALVLLAVAILVAVSRNASAARRRAERQRKYRTLGEPGRGEMDLGGSPSPNFDPPPAAQTSYVNPFVAAAGGAVAGAAATAAFSHARHDEQPAAEAVQHEATVQEAPAHEAPVVHEAPFPAAPEPVAEHAPVEHAAFEAPAQHAPEYAPFEHAPAEPAPAAPEAAPEAHVTHETPFAHEAPAVADETPVAHEPSAAPVEPPVEPYAAPHVEPAPQVAWTPFGDHGHPTSPFAPPAPEAPAHEPHPGEQRAKEHEPA